MKTFAFSALAGAGMMLASLTAAHADTVYDAWDKWTVYSDATVACVASDARTRLSAGQYAYLEALVDGTVPNAAAARRAAGISAGQAMQVHGFIWTAGPRCVMAN